MGVTLKESTVRFEQSQNLLHEVGKAERSRMLNLAMLRFLAWDSYVNTDWDRVMVGLSPLGDGRVWLDVVEMGVDMKTRSNLLKPVGFAIPSETFEMMELAEKRVLKLRSHLQGKGVMAGMIRSAIAQDILAGMLGEESID
jgi:hypothetical protein